MLEGPQEQGEENGRGRGETGNKEEAEGVYDFLGEDGGDGPTYEVPISTIPTPAQPAIQQVAEPMHTENSTLQGDSNQPGHG